MRTPRAFISSTIYDLQAERIAISRLLKVRGFEPLLSEGGDTFPVNPFAHDTYENCLEQVREARIFVMYLGKRLGGTRSMPWDQTVVVGEFKAALNSDLGIPIYIFVDEEVHNLRRAYKNDTSENKKYFESLHGDNVDVRVFEFMSLFADIFDEIGERKRNFWYWKVNAVREVEETLSKQLTWLLDDALRAYSQASPLKLAPYKIHPLKFLQEKNGEISLRLKFSNHSRGDLMNVHGQLFCRIKSDMRYWHEIPPNGLAIAPFINAIADGTFSHWNWTFRLKGIEAQLVERGISKGITDKLVDLILNSDIESFRHDYICNDWAEIKETELLRKNISFFAVVKFIEATSGKMKVVNEEYFINSLILNNDVSE